VNIFAGIGLLATLLALLAVLAVMNVRIGPRSYDHIFNWGGLDPRQNFSVVWDRSEAPSRDGPWEVICFQLQEGGFSPREPDRWSLQSTDAWEAKVRDDALIGEAGLGCIPEVELKSNSTAFFLWQAEYFGQNMSGVTAIFYHRPTRRMLFLNWAT
jgi:hypothetical protein